jgi:hypothetical protein
MLNAKNSYTWDEMLALSESPEAQARLDETIARLKTMPVKTTEDPENPWITEEKWANAMTREEFTAYRRQPTAG